MRPGRHRSSKPKPYPSQRYGAAHRALRARLARVVVAGAVQCARCDDLIEPSDEWQLDHRDDGHGWLGPSHKKCNLRAGWQKMVDSNGHGEFEERPYLWSQRWSDDPPVGTQVLLGEGMAEVYLGHGQWSHPVPFSGDMA